LSFSVPPQSFCQRGFFFVSDAVFVLLVAYRSGSAETHFFTAGCPSFTDYNGNPADKVSESFRTRARFAFLFPLDGVMKAVGCLPFAMGQHYNASRPDQGDRL
jgi:hypothetical protein